MMRLLSLFFLLSALTVNSFVAAATINEREYSIKAAFIANFVRYTRWSTFDNEQFRFCVSNQAVNAVFVNRLADETWFDRKPVFTLVDDTDSISCDLLFIDKDSSAQWRNHLEHHPPTNMLIISESRGMSQAVSHINFFLADNKLRFEINTSRVENSHLTINASLLRLARITSTAEVAND